jgi:hypothetical protein
MPQLFRPRSNTIARAGIAGAVLLLAVLTAGLVLLDLSSFSTRAEVPREQPVPFSHKHHVSGLGVDCRYCHTTVETSAFAGIPPTETCITCHSQIWADSPMLEPVRASWRDNKSLHWTRVHDLPGFVYFNHSIHVNKGVGCATCHGRVDLMPLTWQVSSLTMGWCLDCHRAPERFIRPRSEVFRMDYEAPKDQETLGKKLMAEYNVRKLEDCYTCHR